MTRRIARFRRHIKALSPIFAVLILIAIAVIAGIIVYMFTSGYLGTMMGGGSAGQEKVAIESVQVGNGTITLWAKSTGGGEVQITEVILRDLHGNQVGAPDDVTGTLTADGDLVGVVADFTLSSGVVYTAALVSKVGNQFVSPSFNG